jgi:hypothetical protein
LMSDDLRTAYWYEARSAMVSDWFSLSDFMLVLFLVLKLFRSRGLLREPVLSRAVEG